MQTVSDDPRLTPIGSKVEAGERLSFEDGLTLYGTHDIPGVGHLANLVQQGNSGPSLRTQGIR